MYSSEAKEGTLVKLEKKKHADVNQGRLREKEQMKCIPSEKLKRFAVEIMQKAERQHGEMQRSYSCSSQQIEPWGLEFHSVSAEMIDA